MTSSASARTVKFACGSLIKEVRFTECRRETKRVQLRARRNFSGVSLSDRSGMSREETVCRTPFEA